MSTRIYRLLLGGIGVLAIGYGIARLLTDAKDTHPPALLKWLIGSLLVHDVIIAPVVVGLGWLLSRFVPGRARRYLQAVLVCGGLVAAVGVLLIWRQGKYSAASLALLQQDYRRNLLILLAIVAVAGLAGYGVEVARSNRRNTRPPADH